MLSKRLQKIADMVECGSKLADIGTDHAYLPVYLMKEKKILSAVAGDIHYGPYKTAYNFVRNNNMDNSIDVRIGDGLTILNPGETDVLVIAGMGGATIVKILASCPEVVKCFRIMIFQPMVAANLLRSWLVVNGWKICIEHLVSEDGKLYEIIVVQKGANEELTPLMAEIGPRLWEDKPLLIFEHLQQLLNKKRRIIAQMEEGSFARHTDKYKIYLNDIKQLEAMICQLPIAK